VERVLEWGEAFLLDRQSRGLSPNTIAHYRSGLKTFARIVGDKMVRDLTADDLRRFLVRSFEEGLNPGGVNARWRAVRAFVRWLAEEEVLPNPAPLLRVKGPKVPEKDLAVVRPWEVQRMLLAAHGSSHPLRDAAILLLLWDTAMRLGELLSVRLGDVLPHGVRVRRKGGHEQVLPVSLPTKRALRAYMQSERPPADSDFVFLGKGGNPLTPSGVREILERLAARAGVPYKPPHAFRRGAAVAMVKNGLNPYALQLLMGHRDAQMTAHYVRLAEKDLQEAHRQVSPVLALGGSMWSRAGARSSKGTQKP